MNIIKETTDKYGYRIIKETNSQNQLIKSNRIPPQHRNNLAHHRI
ncbi:hypothetical protein PSOL_04420 [Candidatus Phytoplasma solani]